MPRISLVTATFLAASVLWSGASLAGAEPSYRLACKSLWIKLNNAPLTIHVEPSTDVFFIDAAKNTINDIPGVISATEIRWEKIGTPTERTTYLANKATGQYTVLSEFVNPITGSPMTSEFSGQCERAE